MTIAITGHGSRGDYHSIEDHVRQWLDASVAERAAKETDHLAWAHPVPMKRVAPSPRVGIVPPRTGNTPYREHPVPGTPPTTAAR